MTAQEYLNAQSSGLYIDPKSGEALFASWHFIERFHPDYSHADEIAWIDDLECAICDECDDAKLERVKVWGQTVDEWFTAHEALMKIILKRAFENYKQINNIK